MLKLISPETTELLRNIAIIAVIVLVFVFLLRKVFRVAWKVIRFLLIAIGILVVVGVIAGWLKVSLI